MMRSNNTKKPNANPANNEPHFSLSNDGQSNVQDDFSFRMAFMGGENPVLFLPPQQVYRGDLRMPEGVPEGEGIFYKGFQALGTDPDLWRHIHAEGNSAYVSASLSKKTAGKHPKGCLPENTYRSYVYEIHPTKPGVPVIETLRQQGFPGEDDLSYFVWEKERAFLSEIKSSEIKGCWQVDITKVMKGDPKKFAQAYSKEWIEYMCYEYVRVIQKDFIPNPNYRAPAAKGQSLWLIGKPIGIGLTAFSFGVDANHLYDEFTRGQETGDYNNAYRETAGVAGGWPTALVAGRWGAKLATMLCATLPPWGRILCTAGVEMVFSIIGYDAGNKEGKIIYDDTKRNSAVCNKKLIADNTINKSSTFSLFGNANAKEVLEETDLLLQKSTQKPITMENSRIQHEENYQHQPKLNSYLQPETPPLKRNTFFSAVNNQSPLDNPYITLGKGKKFMENLSSTLLLEHPDIKKSSLNQNNIETKTFSKPANTSGSEKAPNPSLNVHHQLNQDLEFMEKMANDLFQTHFGEHHLKDSETFKINITTSKKPVIKNPEQFKQEAASLVSGLKELRVANDKLVLMVEEERSDGFDLNEMADSLCKWGSAAFALAGLGKELGHRRTWEGVEKTAEGLYRLGTAFFQMNAPDAGPADFLAGGFGGALGFLSIAKALFGNDVRRDHHMEALTQIMEAIQTLHRSMLEGFWRLEKLIHQNMMSVHYRLGRIQKQLDVLKGLVVIAAQELHQTNLINAVSDIEKNMERQRYLRDETINDHLQCLQNWMEHHVFSCIQTDSLEKREDAEQHVSLLRKVSSVGNVFPVFVFQLQQLLPRQVFHCEADIKKLPNVELLMQLSKTLVKAVQYYNDKRPTLLRDNYVPILDKTIESLNLVKEILHQFDQTMGGKNIFRTLLLQCRELQQQIGLALQACFADVPNLQSYIASDMSLNDFLPDGGKKDQWLALLDQLEWRRLMLRKLCGLTGNPGPWTNMTITNIASKEMILDFTVSHCLKQANYFWNTIYSNDSHDYYAFEQALHHGANIYEWRGYTSNQEEKPIHHIIRYQLPVRFLHSLINQEGFKELGELKAQMLKLKRPQGLSKAPAELASHQGSFDLVFLFCAAGIDLAPNEDRSRWQNVITKRLIAKMNDENSSINKADLRKAYQFFCAMEEGRALTVPSKISHNCLLWLTALLGGPVAIIILDQLDVHPDQKLSRIGFTPLMMAAYCGHENIVQWLLKKGADPDIIAVDNDGALDMALYRKNWAVANILIEAGAIATDAQRETVETHLDETDNKLDTPPGPVSPMPALDDLCDRVEETIRLLTRTKASLIWQGRNRALMEEDKRPALADRKSVDPNARMDVKVLRECLNTMKNQLALLEQQLPPLDEEKKIEKLPQKEEKKITSSTRHAPYLLCTQPVKKAQHKPNENEETNLRFELRQ